MNNEIKEILELNGEKHNVYLPKEIIEAFRGIDYELSVCSVELPKILDYINNLQEENERLKERVQIGQNAFLSLNNRIDKAIEYLKEALDNHWDIEAKDLLEILKGED